MAYVDVLPEGCDCLDIGAGPNSLEWCREFLGARKPLGVNIEPSRLEAMHAAGETAMDRNVFDLDPSIRVPFVMFSHFLEHLPDPEACSRALDLALGWATDTVYIAGPFFEEDDKARERGLKFFWGDWVDHDFRYGLKDVLAHLADRSSVTVSVGFPLCKASDPGLLPLSAPRDQPPEAGSGFDKRGLSLHRPLYQEFLVCVSNSRSGQALKAHHARHGRMGYRTPHYFSPETTSVLRRSGSAGGSSGCSRIFATALRSGSSWVSKQRRGEG